MRFMSNPARQFVLLHHILSDGEHWDLMLDLGHVLATWQLHENPAPPIRRGALRGLPAHRIADHRRAYLHLEGPVSGDRGNVVRLDRGVYTLLEELPACWVVRLEGFLLTGIYRLPAGAEPGEFRPMSPDQTEV